jgi:hypothetical protein
MSSHVLPEDGDSVKDIDPVSVLDEENFTELYYLNSPFQA